MDSLGSAVHLTAFSLPVVVEEERKVPVGQACLEMAQLLNQPEMASKLVAFLSSEAGELLTSGEVKEKELRTQVHTLARQVKGLETKTNNDNCIEFSRNKRKKDRSSLNFKALGGDYLHFTLYKENKDTMEAVNTIARLIKMDSKSFTFCDTKDKRGVTTQRVSAFKIHAHRLLGLNKT